jgi:hypothetical protein
MSTEFSKIGPNRVTSARGFTVIFYPAGGVDYMDSVGTIRVDTELHVKPLTLRLYRQSKDLKRLGTARADEILGDIQRALNYLGHPNEVSPF